METSPVFVQVNAFFNYLLDGFGYCAVCKRFTRPGTHAQLVAARCPSCACESVFGAQLAAELGLISFTRR